MADSLEQISALVQNIAAKNMIDASGSFNDLMAGKIADALDIRRQEIAASLFGAKEETPPATEDPVVTEPTAGATA